MIGGKTKNWIRDSGFGLRAMPQSGRDKQPQATSRKAMPRSGSERSGGSEGSEEVKEEGMRNSGQKTGRQGRSERSVSSEIYVSWVDT